MSLVDEEALRKKIASSVHRTQTETIESVRDLVEGFDVEEIAKQWTATEENREGMTFFRRYLLSMLGQLIEERKEDG